MTLRLLPRRSEEEVLLERARALHAFVNGDGDPPGVERTICVDCTHQLAGHETAGMIPDRPGAVPRVLRLCRTCTKEGRGPCRPPRRFAP